MSRKSTNTGKTPGKVSTKASTKGKKITAEAVLQLATSLYENHQRRWAKMFPYH